MSRNIFRSREVGLKTAGNHLRIFSEIKSDNRKNILNSLTQIRGKGGGAAESQWLRCCATNRKVAGSIPAVVSGFFY